MFHSNEQIAQLVAKGGLDHEWLVTAEEIVQTDFVLVNDGGEVVHGIYDAPDEPELLPNSSQMS